MPKAKGGRRFPCRQHDALKPAETARFDRIEPGDRPRGRQQMPAAAGERAEPGGDRQEAADRHRQDGAAGGQGAGDDLGGGRGGGGFNDEVAAADQHGQREDGDRAPEPSGQRGGASGIEIGDGHHAEGAGQRRALERQPEGRADGAAADNAGSIQIVEPWSRDSWRPRRRHAAGTPWPPRLPSGRTQ